MFLIGLVAAGVALAIVGARPHPAPVTTARGMPAMVALGSLPYPPARLPHPSPSSTPAPPTRPSTANPGPTRYYSVSAQQRLINLDRARYGLPPLAPSPCLYDVAVANASRMAAQGYVSHANGVYQDLACGLGHRSGENIGYYSVGVDDSLLNVDFMNSPVHRANILGPYRFVSTAWAIAPNGYAYVAVEFD